MGFSSPIGPSKTCEGLEPKSVGVRKIMEKVREKRERVLRLVLAEVLPPCSHQFRTGAIALQHHLWTLSAFPHAADGVNGYSPQLLWYQCFRRCREEQLVIFSAVQRLLQRRTSVHGERRGINFCRQAALFAQMGQISREPIADIDSSRCQPSGFPTSS